MEPTLIWILVSVLGGFVLALLLGRGLVPALRALKAGQSIREVGPKWHQGKSGTPTMGGIVFILSSLLCIVTGWHAMRETGDYKHLFVLATYMDTLRPGRGCADILPEGLKAAGAVGVMINHCEKPMSLPQMKKTIDRARELDFLVFACADTLDEAKAIAQLHPDIINPEPSEIIGGGKGASPMAYVRDSIKVIKEIDPNIMVEQAAGITCGQEVYDFIMAGSEAAGAASGIMNAADPIAMIDEMIAATRRAADDLKKQEG